MSLVDIFSRVLGEPPTRLTDESSPTTVGAWNSLRHIELIVEIENCYGVRFSRSEIVSLRSVGEIRAMLRNKGVPDVK